MLKFKVTTSLLPNTVCSPSLLYPERPPRQVSWFGTDESTVVAGNYDCILWTKEYIRLRLYFRDRGPYYLPTQ